MFMSVTLKLSKIKTIDEGYEWADSLPNSWFNKPYGFDGNDFGPLGRSAPKSKEYTLFWNPKSTKATIDLVSKIAKDSRKKYMRNTTLSMTIEN